MPGKRKKSGIRMRWGGDLHARGPYCVCPPARDRENLPYNRHRKDDGEVSDWLDIGRSSISAHVREWSRMALRRRWASIGSLHECPLGFCCHRGRAPTTHLDTRLWQTSATHPSASRQADGLPVQSPAMTLPPTDHRRCCSHWAARAWAASRSASRAGSPRAIPHSVATPSTRT